MAGLMLVKLGGIDAERVIRLATRLKILNTQTKRQAGKKHFWIDTSETITQLGLGVT